MTCWAASSKCRGGARSAYKLAMRREIVRICDDCRVELSREPMGLTFIPWDERVHAVPVEQDRRRFVPRWLANLTAKELTSYR